MENRSNVTLTELLSVFLKLGTIGFGGPLAHMALMREEIVAKRKWITEEEFMDLIGACNLIPGPNSTELAIHIGHKLGGFPGLLITGISFILPAFLSVLGLAFLYVHYGSLPELGPILMGVRPVIMAIVAIALFKFRETTVRNWQEVLIVLFGLLSLKFGWNEVLFIFSAGLLLLGLKAAEKKRLSVAILPVFFYFLKLGSVLFGSGYVLLAFLQNDLVREKGWLTSTQLLDAVTVGQFTPGPVFTTATFIGYLLNGFSGAVIATIGIFLPSFFFVAISAPFLKRLRSSQNFSFFLNGVNTASFTLMFVVSLELGQKSFTSLTTFTIGVISFILLKLTKINSVWAILAGGAVGYFFF